MENKTPMQEAIEICETLIENSLSREIIEALVLLKFRLKNELFEKEEKLIANAHSSNCKLFSCEQTKENCQCGIDYYNEKFNNNERT